jgi:hypothetical protein
LQFVTYAENLAVNRRNRWHRDDGGADVCKYNHPFTPENTLWNLSRGNLVRRCKACARETARRHMIKSRGGDPGPFAPRMDYEPRKKPPPKTHCPEGHEYTPENTYWRPDGKGRECCTCFGRNPRPRS